MARRKKTTTVYRTSKKFQQGLVESGVGGIVDRLREHVRSEVERYGIEGATDRFMEDPDGDLGPREGVRAWLLQIGANDPECRKQLAQITAAIAEM